MFTHDRFEERRVRKCRKGVDVVVEEDTGRTYIGDDGEEKTYKNHKGAILRFFTYTPTDCPQTSYTSYDMALAAATYEHGAIRPKRVTSEEYQAPKRRKSDKRDKHTQRN